MRSIDWKRPERLASLDRKLDGCIFLTDDTKETGIVGLPGAHVHLSGVG